MKKPNSFTRPLYLILVFALLYLPIVTLMAFSFNESKLNAVWTGFTFKWYESLLQNEGVLEAARNSFSVALVSTVVSVIIGTLTALGLYRYKFRGKGFLDAVLTIPIIIPEIVMGISLLAFFSIMRLPLGRLSLIVAHVTFSVAYVVAVVKARLDGYDKSVEEAAADLGATPLKVFFNVTLPVIMPGVIAGAFLAFTLSLDDVVISFFVAGPQSTTLPLKVFSMVKFGVTPEINALSTIIMLVTLSAVGLSSVLRKVNLSLGKIGGLLAAIAVLTGGTGYGVWAFAKGPQTPRETLSIFNWSEYLPHSVVEQFERAYNIKVHYNTFSSNEEMLAKLMAGGGVYDLAVASDFMVEILKKQGLLLPVRKENVPNLSNIGTQYMGLPFDSENEYSLPYMWLAGIIAYDASKIPEGVIEGYADLWKPELKHSLTILDDQRAIIGITLKTLGYSLNETSPEALEKAREALKALQPNVKSYDSDSPKTSLINGEAKAIFAWGAEANLARRENPNVKYVVPKEGLFLQQDNFVIPKSAKNVGAAELFMNFVMDPEISAEISAHFPYGNPNVEAYRYIDQEILDDTAVYPPEDEVRRGEYLRDIGEAALLFDRIWSEVKQ